MRNIARNQDKLRALYIHMPIRKPRDIEEIVCYQLGKLLFVIEYLLEQLICSSGSKFRLDSEYYQILFAVTHAQCDNISEYFI